MTFPGHSVYTTPPALSFPLPAFIFLPGTYYPVTALSTLSLPTVPAFVPCCLPARKPPKDRLSIFPRWWVPAPRAALAHSRCSKDVIHSFLHPFKHPLRGFSGPTLRPGQGRVTNSISLPSEGAHGPVGMDGARPVCPHPLCPKFSTPCLPALHSLLLPCVYMSFSAMVTTGTRNQSPFCLCPEGTSSVM